MKPLWEMLQAEWEAQGRPASGKVCPPKAMRQTGYFFTSLTSFANPAIDVGRMFSNAFAGIAPASVPSFIVFQLIGGAVAIGVIQVLYPDITPEEASEIMLPPGPTFG